MGEPEETLIRIVALAAVVAAVAPATAAAAPAITPGWPQPVPGGSVERTPAGGAAVIGTFGDAVAVTSFGRDGSRRFTTWRIPACGDCDARPGPSAALRADGTYGPIRFARGDWWAVDQGGRVVPGCPGVVLADGTCIASVTVTATPPVNGSAALRSTRGGATLWQYVEPDSDFTPDPPPVVRDGAGTVYAGFTAGGVTAPARMVAVDGTTGAFRWRAPDAEPLAALASGVLARTADGITAYDAAGAVRWTAPLNGTVTADDVSSATHAGPSRVYVDTGGGIVALDAATGAQAWRTADADQARLLSVTPSGDVLAAITRDRRVALRAISPAGRGRWQLDTTGVVLGARELADGTVGLTTSGLHNGMGDLLLRVDPRRRAAVPRAARLTLSRTSVRVRCTTETCDISPGLGTILRLDMPRATTATITMREPDGRPTPRMIVKSVRVTPGAGSSWVRLLVGENRMAPGRHLVSVRWRDRGRTLTRNLPVIVR